VADIVKLGQVSQTYAGQMDEFGKLLKNSSKVSRTVADKEDEIGDLFGETDKLADVLRAFFEATGEDLIKTAANSVRPLQVGEEYSSIFPCWLKGHDYLLRTRLDSVLKNKTLHIDMKMIAPQPTVYDVATERPVMPSEDALESLTLTQPEVRGYAPDGTPLGLGTICDELNAAAAGNPRTNENPLPIPGGFWKLLGITNSHNGKLGTEADYARPMASANLVGIDTPAQKDVLNRMTTALTGVESKDVPDVASLLISPVIRGAEVSIK
jgi:hypothetical protein